MGSSISPSHRQKSRSLEKFLCEEFVLVHINPQHAEVVLPDYLRTQSTVTLKLSHHFRGQLTINREQVMAELSFKGSLTRCVIPFDAIWAMTSLKGEKLFWPEAAHEEVQKLFKEEFAVSGSPSSTSDEKNSGQEQPVPKTQHPTSPARPALALAPATRHGEKDDASPLAGSAEKGENEAKPRPARGHLKRVK